MAWKYLNGSDDKSWLNSLKAKERCCSGSSLICFIIGYTILYREQSDNAALLSLAAAPFKTYLSNIHHCIIKQAHTSADLLLSSLGNVKSFHIFYLTKWCKYLFFGILLRDVHMIFNRFFATEHCGHRKNDRSMVLCCSCCQSDIFKDNVAVSFSSGFQTHWA